MLIKKSMALLQTVKVSVESVRDMAKASSLATKTIRNIVSEDHDTLKPQLDRYHLYASYACPWAQRALIVRSLKGLESAISVDILHWRLTDQGWLFKPDAPQCTPDSVNSLGGMQQIYKLQFPDYKGKFTVPVLYDKINKEIVNNKAKDIVRTFGNNFNKFCSTQEQSKINLYPEQLQSEIDLLDKRINTDLAEGVYKVGRSITDFTRDKASKKLFDLLDELDQRLSNQDYIFGNSLTETDINIYTTFIRFDKIYYTYFKCNKKKLSEYKNLNVYLERLNSLHHFSDSTNFEHILKYQQNID